MKNRRFMLCQYPEHGFGAKSGEFYLLNAFGSKFHIVNEYDNVLKEMNKKVCFDDRTYCEDSIDKLIDAIESDMDTKIERW